MAEKLVLAYSGGLDTSVSIPWIRDHYGYDVIAMCVDVGEGKDLDATQAKAIQVGAVKSYKIDAKAQFAESFILPALKANALYEGKYPLASALSRPLISKLLVEVAEREGAVAVAHGCTGKGNDQVRFEVSIHALNPNLKVIAPVREWGFTRDEEIRYAKEHGVPIPVDLDNPFSIDANLWGRAIECGVLEDPWQEAPEGAFLWTVSPEEAPDEPEEIVISFEQGKPVALNGESLPLVDLIHRVNEIAGRHGVGRIDHVENRLVGIKSREVYESPAGKVLIMAHQELEHLTLTREVLQYKMGLELEYAKLIYNGLWYSPLKAAFDAFIDETQRYVTGDVRVKLYKGHAQATGRKSPYSLYRHDLATYETGDKFDHGAAVGFIRLYGLPTTVYATLHAGEEKPTNLGDDAYSVLGDEVEAKA
ncbi:argininosuccinate synthase [Alicyclobacillus acidocaldarius]|uniref:Argininosuccinate synthase n=1 Tax=Alicyclobacillus acidocaldarius subsp. acidocaldarius (strain ATCC 27009 / DSM 446 / BCRC 14685 / JCM 5260 / KCTC 1825 / NBRC 15652 / NCIMB 11725 / NRRL B-14509 / 104-IA) TaxID=521098 RepID=C8WVY5_ALIAD|nr:argininosuccinate synthase [Alicyclobacillus acidocaldarius]ACV58257.1 argininosuccinate synthase [Alicyclobacillus acidocaldarius subsp. acidocaldarius DSM 446]